MIIRKNNEFTRFSPGLYRKRLMADLRKRMRDLGPEERELFVMGATGTVNRKVKRFIRVATGDVPAREPRYPLQDKFPGGAGGWKWEGEEKDASLH